MVIEQRILRYICGTKDQGIRFLKNKKVILKGFCDNDLEDCMDDMKSTSDYVFNLGFGAFC